MQDNAIEIVKTYFEKITAEGPVDAVFESISPDFKLIAGTAEIDRQGFINILKLLYAAIPDLAHVLSDVQARGEVVQLTDRPVGNFTGAWDGSGLGLPAVQASGGAFKMAPSKWEITVRNGKITRWHDVTIPSVETGLRGFYKALGASAPAIRRWNAV